MFRRFNKWCFGAITVLLLTGTFEAQAQGEALFKAKCATCHMPHKNSTGPKLFEARKIWDAAGEGDLIFDWVKNNSALRASGKSKRAAEVFAEYKGASMTAFADLSNEDITAIFDWVDEQPLPGAAVAGATPGAVAVAGETEEADFSWTWILLGAVFVVIIMAVGGVRRQLKRASDEAEGLDSNDKSYAEEFRSWAWKNKIYVGIGSLVLILALLVSALQGLGSIGVVEAYQPSQPIDFPHETHAGINGIDCKYCHNSVTKSRSAGLPTVNVCMNCHKQVSGNTPEQQAKIAKIYAAAGWSTEGAGGYVNKENPIVWNKVHVLPDHVYFNHSQHVVVGGIDCKQCHGDMTKQKETARVVPVEELNKIEGNIQLTKPTLTMGWCIECHGEKEVSNGSLDSKNDGYYNEIHKRLLNNDKTLYKKYLEDGKVTVKELGGWECAKCHY